MASFAQLTPADIIETPADIIKNIHDITVSQIPAIVTQIAELPLKTGPAIPTGAGTSGYRATIDNKPVVVKKNDVLFKIQNNILTKSLSPEAIKKGKTDIITTLFNETVNYYEVSQIPGHFLCRFIGYKIEYEWNGFLENSTFFVYIVMEDCGAEDLFSFCARIMTPVRYAKYLLENKFRILSWAFVQALLALQKLHSNGWVHLDLKAENIFINDTSKMVLLGDFGSVTKIIPEGNGSHMVDGPIGTSQYIAPELLSASGRINNNMLKHADIYALFKSYEFLINGYCKINYRENLKNEVIMFILGEGGWFEKILNPDPTRRPSADELIARIRIVNPAYLESYDVFKERILDPEEAIIQRAKEEQERKNREEREQIRIQIMEQERIEIMKQEEETKNSKKSRKSDGGRTRRRTKTHRSSKKGRKKRGTQKTNRRRRR